MMAKGFNTTEYPVRENCNTHFPTGLLSYALKRLCFINFQETNSSPLFSIPVSSQRGHYSRFSQLQLVSSINIKASLTFVIMPLTPLKVCSMVSTCLKRGASPRPPLGASRACQTFRAAPRTIHWETVSAKDYSVLLQLIQNFKQLCPQST